MIYPDYIVNSGRHRWQSALQTSQKEKNEKIPFTITIHSHYHAVQSIILKNCKLLQNDPETGTTATNFNETGQRT